MKIGIQHKYFNRELSWLEFNARVIEEAKRSDIPLLERLKFLSIGSSNLDEFFMVRVAGLKRAQIKEPDWTDIASLTPHQQLTRIADRAHSLVQLQYSLLNDTILPSLSSKGLDYISSSKITPEEKNFLDTLFEEQIYPLLTPLRTDHTPNLPPLPNLKLHAAFLLKAITEMPNLPLAFKNHSKHPPLALVQIPTSLDRIVWLPSQEDGKKRFTLLDDIIILFGTRLFPGYKVEEHIIFQLTNDAAFSVDEERNSDFIEAMEEVIQARKTSLPVRFVCNNESPQLRKILVEKTNLTQKDVYEVAGILDLPSCSSIINAEGFNHLRFPAWKHYTHKNFEHEESIWTQMKKEDILIHVPYESFDPVIKFIEEAADDPHVLAIKMTLYRTSGNSPVIRALKRAALNGKQVTVFVELKARFDEKRNISWAEILQDSGVIVVHGIENLKVHAKLLMVVRKEEQGIMRYIHLATGNYNDKTAKIYVDMSIFTTNNDIASDTTLFFNTISGYSSIQTMNQLCIAPINLKSQLLSMIEREIQHSTPETPGLIMAKINSLGDKDIIDALYKASLSHVRIMLNIRGICMLVPGVQNQSENITVISIIGRYLEHTRIVYFQNGGDEELYLSSADWLPRNLERRVELMFPVLQEDLKEEIKNILNLYFSDNCRSHYLKQTGRWVALKPLSNEASISVQQTLNIRYKNQSKARRKEIPSEFRIRRNEPHQ